MGGEGGMFFPEGKRGSSEQSFGRRHFLKLGAFATLATLSPRWGFAALDNSHVSEKSISFYNQLIPGCWIFFMPSN
jgi:hypothetical protein